MSIETTLLRVSKLRLSGGLVGRVCTVLIVACAALGAIGALSHNEWIMGAAILAIFVLAFPMLWRIVGFAERNPHVAILDGAQFLKHEQLLLASKSNPEIEVNPETQTEPRPPLLAPSSNADVDEPDNDSGGNATTDDREGA